ncbi:helix-turn-helix domain-containing protein [Marinitoga lauensis]|uniref:helix-turn-helix domain-containing protein n=1 Tax=Marinitoga lauensis TaxID=2201189 RepID=UPI0010104BF0
MIEFKGKKFYSTKEVAERFEVHPDTIRRWIKRKKIKAKKIGVSYYVEESEIEKLLFEDLEKENS